MHTNVHTGRPTAVQARCAAEHRSWLPFHHPHDVHLAWVIYTACILGICSSGLFQVALIQCSYIAYVPQSVCSACPVIPLGGGGTRQVPPTLWPCNRWTSGPALPSFSQPNPWRCFHPAVSAVTSASQHCHNMVYSAVTLASQCCHSSHTPPSGCSQRLQSAIQRRYHSQPALPHHQRHSTSAQLQHDCCQTAWQQHCGAAVAGRMPVDMTLHAVCACCRIAYSAFCGISVS